MFCGEQRVRLAFPGKMLSGHMKCPTQGGKAFRSTGYHAPKLTDFCSQAVAFCEADNGNGSIHLPLARRGFSGKGMCVCESRGGKGKKSVKKKHPPKLAQNSLKIRITNPEVVLLFLFLESLAEL